MLRFIDAVRQAVKRVMHVFTIWLNKITGGKLSPNAVTIVGMLMHIPIAVLIATGDWVIAAVALTVFGLFDTLDGDLARLQGRESPNGRLLDSVTDRVKEVILYVGIIYAFATTGAEPRLLAVATAALGCSVLTSYLNATGDAIMAKHFKNNHAANTAFRGGWFPFEIRMFLIVVGLLVNQLPAVVILIAAGAAYTAFERMIRVYGVLAKG